MKLTRKQIIDNKYNELLKYIKLNLGVDFFPSLDVVDTADVLILIQMYFSPHYESGTYDVIIKEGLRMKDLHVDNETFDTHYPRIKEDIDFIIKFMREQRT